MECFGHERITWTPCCRPGTNKEAQQTQILHTWWVCCLRMVSMGHKDFITIKYLLTGMVEHWIVCVLHCKAPTGSSDIISENGKANRTAVWLRPQHYINRQSEGACLKRRDSAWGGAGGGRAGGGGGGRGDCFDSYPARWKSSVSLPLIHSLCWSLNMAAVVCAPICLPSSLNMFQP